MKLRAVTLENVRRFTDPVRIGPIGDGLTLLCEPNESGKSTLFDALHALFFVSHTSWAAEVRDLQPHSGGKVSVGAELEIDGIAWRIWKQWQPGAGGLAKVWRGEVLTYQGDEARDWIRSLIEGEGGGPAGLLWVRQGRVTLSADGKYGRQDESGDEHAGRRDLLTAVSGAMDEVTGGQRMDAALDRVRVTLGALETATGRPKVGGAWAIAEAEVEEWHNTSERLEALVAELRDALDEQRGLKRDAATQEDPTMLAERKAALKSAEEAFEDARAHAVKLEAAQARARLARQEHAAAAAAAAQVSVLRQDLEEADRTKTRIDAAARTADADAAEAETTLKAAMDKHAAAEENARSARVTLRAINDRHAATMAEAQRRELEDRIARAEEAEKAAEAQEAAAARGPDRKTTDRIDTLARDLDRAEAQRDAGAPRVSVSYLPDAPRVILDGDALKHDRATAVREGSRLTLPGIGEMTLTLAGSGTTDRVSAVAGALRAALDTGGWADLAAFRDALRGREAAETASRELRATLAALAPNGLGDLRRLLAALPPAVASDESSLPDRETASAALDTAERTLAETSAALRTAQARLGERREAMAAARADARAADNRVARARETLAALGPETDEERNARLASLDRKASSAEAEARALEANAPDLGRAEAHLRRLRAAKDQADSQAQATRTRLAELRALIAARAEDGVEEALADARNRLDAAHERLERVIFEAAVLRRLRAALEDAQAQARDRYFGPVAAELRPMLEDLWDDAEVVWSDSTLLPEALIRRGTREPITVLSGGTQEQIAFLVRLAFARLLARSGRHAPLILDDALVYSDDDRIQRMFDALHLASDDLQIIVLSCRQRAFETLGAPQVRIAPDPA